MATTTLERYSPVVVGVNSTVTKLCTSIGGFFCTVTGTLTLSIDTSAPGAGTSSVTLISAMAVTAGTYYWLPFYVNRGVTVTTAGGASGVLAYD